MGENGSHAQLLVIGAGPAGYAAAFRAADLGLDVTVVSDEERVGGVCLLRGCIPSKTLLSAAELIGTAREAGEHGISFGEPEIDLDRLRGWKDEVVDGLVEGLDGIFEKRGIRRVWGRARCTGETEVEVEGDESQHIGFDNAIVATGSSPVSLPDVEPGDRIMDSARALELADVPERLLVVGGGYVGLEMGMVYATLGSRVTLVEMMDRLMVNADPDLVEPLAGRVEELFEGVHLQVGVEGLEESEDGVEVRFSGEGEPPSETSFDRVLVAIGRRPNTADLGLDAADVEMDDNGFVVVGDTRRTSNARIYAAGDVTGGMMLAHEGMREGKVAAESIAGEPAAFDVRAIPAVVYTDPQIAWCGLTEQEVDDEVKVVRFPWSASGRARSMGATTGFTKLLLEPETGRVLGMGAVGRHAEALISEGVLAMEMGAVADDLALTVHPHPTLSETIGEAAELLHGSATHL